MPSAPRRLRARFVVPLVVVAALGAGIVALKVTVFAAKQAITASLDTRPFPMPDVGPAAPPDEARLLLSPAGLGAGWYVEVPPELDSGPSGVDAGAVQPISSETTSLEKAHRAGNTWTPDSIVLESSQRFATAGQSAARTASYIDESSATRRSVNGVPVFVRVRPHGFLFAAFSRGDRFYGLTVGPSASSAPLPGDQIDAIVAAAVQRAADPATSG